MKDFFSKCDQIRSFLRIWSHLLKKSLMENFIFLCSEGNENVWKYLAEAHLITDYYCKRNVNTIISIGSILSKNPSCKGR